MYVYEILHQYICHSYCLSFITDFMYTLVFYLCLFLFFSTLHPPDATYVIIVLLASLNSCTNPWIYMIYTEGICSKLRGFVTDSRMSGKRRKLSTFFTFDDRSRGTLQVEVQNLALSNLSLKHCVLQSNITERWRHCGSSTAQFENEFPRFWIVNSEVSDPKILLFSSRYFMQNIYLHKVPG